MAPIRKGSQPFGPAKRIPKGKLRKKLGTPPKLVAVKAPKAKKKKKY